MLRAVWYAGLRPTPRQGNRPAPYEKLAPLVFLYNAARLWQAYLQAAIAYTAGKQSFVLPLLFLTRLSTFGRSTASLPV